MKSLTNRVADALGYGKVAVTASVYKLLVYAPGDHFLPHKDTEKIPGMFATLVIQLPSVHTGGSLVVRHCNREWTHDFGREAAPYACHFAAHFADLEHEVIPVTTGYRVLVVYNIAQKAAVDAADAVPVLLPKTCAAPEVEAFAAGFREWDRGVGGLVVFPLQHQYTYDGLHGRGFTGLKGRDRRIGELLLEANAVLPPDEHMEFCISNAKVNQRFTCGQNGYERERGDDNPVRLQHAFSSRGVDIAWAKNLSFRFPRTFASSDGDCASHSDDGRDGDSDDGRDGDDSTRKCRSIGAFSSADDVVLDAENDTFWAFWEHEYDSYTGNEHGDRTTTYSQNVILAWKRRDMLEVSACRGDIPTAVMRFLQLALAAAPRETLVSKAHALLALWRGFAKEDATTVNDVLDVIDVVHQLGEDLLVTLVQTILVHKTQYLNSNAFTTKLLDIAAQGGAWTPGPTLDAVMSYFTTVEIRAFPACSILKKLLEWGAASVPGATWEMLWTAVIGSTGVWGDSPYTQPAIRSVEEFAGYVHWMTTSMGWDTVSRTVLPALATSRNEHCTCNLIRTFAEHGEFGIVREIALAAAQGKHFTEPRFSLHTSLPVLQALVFTVSCGEDVTTLLALAPKWFQPTRSRYTDTLEKLMLQAATTESFKLVHAPAEWNVPAVMANAAQIAACTEQLQAAMAYLSARPLSNMYY